MVVFRCDRCEKQIEDRRKVTFVQVFTGIKAEAGVLDMELCDSCGKRFFREFMIKEEEK